MPLVVFELLIQLTFPSLHFRADTCVTVSTVFSSIIVLEHLHVEMKAVLLYTPLLLLLLLLLLLQLGIVFIYKKILCMGRLLNSG